MKNHEEIKAEYQEYFMDCNDFSIGGGWLPIIEAFLELVNVDKELGLDPLEEPIKLLQIKEKFGALRIYYTGGSDQCADWVDFAEALSGKICEYCGRPSTTRTVEPVKNLCEPCVGEHTKNF